MLSDTIGDDTVDCVQTHDGYQVRLNGKQILFVPYFENRAESRAQILQYAAMVTLKEKQRQEEETNNVYL